MRIFLICFFLFEYHNTIENCNKKDKFQCLPTPKPQSGYFHDTPISSDEPILGGDGG